MWKVQLQRVAGNGDTGTVKLIAYVCPFVSFDNFHQQMNLI